MNALAWATTTTVRICSGHIYLWPEIHQRQHDHHHHHHHRHHLHHLHHHAAGDDRNFVQLTAALRPEPQHLNPNTVPTFLLRHKELTETSFWDQYLTSLHWLLVLYDDR